MPTMRRMSTTSTGTVVLSQLLSANTVKLALAGTTRDEVLLELIAQIPQLLDQAEARQRLLTALVERERLHSTGIGDGVALPHARNALAGVVDHPVIVFGRHTRGIPYGAVDGKPARLFFLLVAPSVTQHLAILARISRLLRDLKLREQLLQADKPEQVLTVVREAEAKM